MNLTALRRLVAQGESLTVEFKRKANHPDKLMKELVAFANTIGGKLLIGIDDDGTIAGVKYVGEDEFVLKQAIEKHCKPMINYQVLRVAVAPDRHVLIFEVLPNAEKPVFVIYNFKKNLGTAYIRVGDQSLQASREMRQILKGISQERQIVFEYTSKEKILMQYLAANQRIDLQTFSSIASTTEAEASQILVRLTIANVLKIEPEEMKDWFRAVV
jgi:predicted HTH transcriptional regulator